MKVSIFRKSVHATIFYQFGADLHGQKLDVYEYIRNTFKKFGEMPKKSHAYYLLPAHNS